VIGTTCLTSETNPKTPAKVISIVSEPKSLERLKDYQEKSDEVVCCKQSFQMRVECLILGIQNNLNILSHVHTVDREVKEFSFMHGESIYYVGMKRLKIEAFHQID
jgi:hypothetical protein